MLITIITWFNDRIDLSDDSGFSTAELMGNAALAVASLVVIWAALRQLGVDVVAQMRTAMSL